MSVGERQATITAPGAPVACRYFMPEFDDPSSQLCMTLEAEGRFC